MNTAVNLNQKNIKKGMELAKKVDLPAKVETPKEEKVVSGRKAESKFVTSLMSRIGNASVNSDYTGYIELDNFGCWIIADGIDDIKGAEDASKKVVEIIIQKFIEKPKFSKSYIKKLLKEAHEDVKKIQQTKKIKLGIGTSLTIILTDYTKIIMGSIGNTRGIILRNELIYKKTKDHNIAYLMYENQSLSYDSIRFSNQKDKLTQYIGTYGGIKPFISKKIDLIEGDKILLLSSGAWENLDESDIEVSLSQSARVGKWIGALEKLIQNSESRKLNNYSTIGIFIDKVAPKKRDFKKIGSKFMLIVPILLIVGYIGYKGYKLKTERNNIYKDIYKVELDAEKDIKQKEYHLALEKYTEIKGKYKELYILPSSGIFKNKIFSSDILNRSVDDQIDNIDEKIKDVELTIKLENLKVDGDLNYKENRFDEAIKNYKEINLLLDQIRIIDIGNKEKWKQENEEKIVASEGLIVGVELRESANEMVDNNEIEAGIRNYLEAKIIFLKYNKIDLLADVTNRAEILTKKREETYQEALKLEKNGLKIETKDINGAVAYFELSKNLYSQLGDIVKEEELNEKIIYLNELKVLLKDQNVGYLRDARVYAEQGQYEKALDIIKKAQNNSNILSDTQGLVDSLEKEGDLFIDNKKYDLAKEKYREAYNTSVNTNNRLQQKELEEKQEISTILIAGDKEEKTADKLFEEKKYKESRLKYLEAKKEYEKLQYKSLYSKDKYNKLIENLDKKERMAWRESNWIPFF